MPYHYFLNNKEALCKSEHFGSAINGGTGVPISDQYNSQLIHSPNDQNKIQNEINQKPVYGNNNILTNNVPVNNQILDRAYMDNNIKDCQSNGNCNVDYYSAESEYINNIDYNDPANVVNYYANNYGNNNYDSLQQISQQYTQNLISSCSNLVSELNKYPNDAAMKDIKNRIVNP